MAFYHQHFNFNKILEDKRFPNLAEELNTWAELKHNTFNSLPDLASKIAEFKKTKSELDEIKKEESDKQAEIADISSKKSILMHDINSLELSLKDVTLSPSDYVAKKNDIAAKKQELSAIDEFIENKTKVTESFELRRHYYASMVNGQFRNVAFLLAMQKIEELKAGDFSKELKAVFILLFADWEKTQATYGDNTITNVIKEILGSNPVASLYDGIVSNEFIHEQLLYDIINKQLEIA